uniref:Uncharacterized protein n=1 Tax=Arundo donax TaxID=35708 RepID=A0A0A9FRZ1_ARUDO
MADVHYDRIFARITEFPVDYYSDHYTRLRTALLEIM